MCRIVTMSIPGRPHLSFIVPSSLAANNQYCPRTKQWIPRYNYEDEVNCQSQVGAQHVAYETDALKDESADENAAERVHRAEEEEERNELGREKIPATSRKRKSVHSESPTRACSKKKKPAFDDPVVVAEKPKKKGEKRKPSLNGKKWNTELTKLIKQRIENANTSGSSDDSYFSSSDDND